MFFRTWKHNWWFLEGFYYIFFLSFERNNLYLTFKYFLYIYCYYKYTAENVDDNMIHLG